MLSSRVAERLNEIDNTPAKLLVAAVGLPTCDLPSERGNTGSRPCKCCPSAARIPPHTYSMQQGSSQTGSAARLSLAMFTAVDGRIALCSSFRNSPPAIHRGQTQGPSTPGRPSYLTHTSSMPENRGGACGGVCRIRRRTENRSQRSED